MGPMKPPVAPERAPEATEDKAEVSSDMIYGNQTPDGRRIKLIIRNSAECTCCGKNVDCTNYRNERGEPAWLTHDCEEAWFSIGGATDIINRCGPHTFWQDTSMVLYMIAVPRHFNPEKKSFIPPIKESA
jgi:hypothetical protein